MTPDRGVDLRGRRPAIPGTWASAAVRTLKYLQGLLLLVGLLLGPQAGAAVLSAPPGASASQPQLLIDPDGKATLGDVMARPGAFTPAPLPLVEGYTHATYWLHFTITRTASAAMPLYLDFGNAMLDHIDVYVLGVDGQLKSQLQGGDALPASAQPYRSTIPAYPLDLGNDPQADIWVRIQSDASTFVAAPRLLDQPELMALERQKMLLHGVLLGLFAALATYNLFVYLIGRQAVYLWYALYLPMAFVAASVLNGFTADVLLPDAVWLRNEGLPLLTGLTFLLNLLFSRAFLDTAAHPRADRIVRLAMLGPIGLILTPILVKPGLSYLATDISLFIFPIFAVGLGIWGLRGGQREARWYLAGQSASWIAMVSFGFLLKNKLSFTDFTPELVVIGVAVDALLLALGLGDRIRRLECERDAAERREQAQLTDQKQKLEALVVARTAELDAALAQAEALAVTDPLTGLHNRRGMHEATQREIARARRSGQPLALAMLDIDHFKRVNDRYGHAVGDVVLVDLARLLTQTVRQSDVISRYGGEEFLLLLPATGPAEAFELAERLRTEVATTIHVEGDPQVPITISIGIAFLDADEPDFEPLLCHADAALYDAKRSGRNRCVIFANTAESDQAT